MQLESTLDVEQQATAQILAELLSRMSKASQTWVDLYAEDAVVEFPYAFNTPRRLEGKAAIYNYIKNALVQMQDLVFTDIHIYPATNPNILWAEVHGEADIVSTSRHYQQDYVMRLETREGKIIHYREYWNPVSALKAWGGTENLCQSFNADSAPKRGRKA